MYQLKDVINVQFELSSFCNARCPMCARFTETGALAPSLKQRHLGKATIQRIIEPKLIPQLVYVYGCGVHGEPMLNPETLEIYDYFRRHNAHLILGGHTNGAVQDKEFWQTMAKLASKINFSIDGLEDTNHLYRQGVNWDQLMENVNAYITAGGYAIWNYLAFKHNEHQVEEARTLAKKLGFKQFIVKSTSRFIHPRDLALQDHWPAFDRAGKETHRLEPSGRFPNQVLQTSNTIGKLETSTICCRAQQDKSLYVDSLGHVLPCCFLGGETVRRPDQADFFSHLKIEGVGLEAFDSTRHSLEEIVGNKVFQRTVPNSWDKPSFREGRLHSCARYCGKDLDIFNSQFSPPEMLN